MTFFLFRFYVFLFFSTAFNINARAQKTEDVIYLKNGWVIRGKVIESTGEAIKIETHDKNIFVFKNAELLEQKKEPISGGEINYKKRGFVNYTEMGPLGAANRASNNVTTSAFSLQTINGYKFNQYLYTGAGIGVDLYALQTLLPLFVSLRGDLNNKTNFIPYYFVDGGYSINSTLNDNPLKKYEGGPMFACGLGLKIMFTRNAGFLFSLGYRYQKAVVEPLNIPNRLAIRAGFSF